MLRVKLVGCVFRSDEDVDDHDDDDGYSSKSYSVSDFYDSLRNIYVLGIEGISLRTEAVLSLSSFSPPQLVCYDFYLTRLTCSFSEHDQREDAINLGKSRPDGISEVASIADEVSFVNCILLPALCSCIACSRIAPYSMYLRPRVAHIILVMTPCLVDFKYGGDSLPA